jgi:hypothetical protein
MKRLRRIIFNSLTVLSLVLCIAMAGLWVRSYWIEDRCYGRRNTYWIGLATYRGELGCELGIVITDGPADLYTPAWAGGIRHVPIDRVPESDAINIAEINDRLARLPHYHDLLGFRWHPRLAGDWERGRGVGLPLWFTVILTAAMPVHELEARRRRHGNAMGSCTSCGYDLRATPDRCPECGTIPRKQQRVADSLE